MKKIFKSVFKSVFVISFIFIPSRKENHAQENETEIENQKSSYDDQNMIFRAILGVEIQKVKEKFKNSTNENTLEYHSEKTLSNVQSDLKKSEEFENSMISFIPNIYLTLMGRFPDKEGVDFWKDKFPLENYSGFQSSIEFKNIKSLRIHEKTNIDDFDLCFKQNSVLQTSEEVREVIGDKNADSQWIETVRDRDIYIVSIGKQKLPKKIEIYKVKEYEDMAEVMYTVRDLDNAKNNFSCPSVVFTTDKTSKMVSFKFVRSDRIDDFKKIKDEYPQVDWANLNL